MEGQEYLNQISGANRPVKKSRSGIFSSKLFIFGAVAAVALIAMVIFGMVMGSSGNSGGEKNLGYALKLHIDNTSAAISEYQSLVKSSELRSSSASLYSVLSNTSRDLTGFLTEKYNLKDKEIDKKILANATTASEELVSELFEAKINGILDRIYAHKMTYEITVIMTEEAKLMDVSKNSALDEILTTSYNSLENLYEKFSDFSETK